MKPVKPAKTIEEQLDILQAKGVIINNRTFANKVLSSVNYYSFTGYLFQFKNEEGKYDNIDFDTVYNIYKCDKRLRSVLLYAIEAVERNLKTKMAYSLAHSISPLGYMSSRYFINPSEHEKMLNRFEKNVNNNNRIPFVKHHITNYDGQFPVWVAIELFTLGMLWNCYKNLKTQYKKDIARMFNTGANQLESWIECVSYIRNFAAHDMRLYDFNVQKTPKHCKKNFKNFEQSNKLYDIIYIMKFLVADKHEWNKYIIPSIKNTFKYYNHYIDISCYGFPEDWEKTLIKQ